LPTYEYHCDTCDTNFDVVQSFHDDALTQCPTCGSPVRKVFGNVGIVFKGSGFYKTDSRDGGKAKTAVNEPSPSSSDGDNSGSKPADASPSSASPDSTPTAPPKESKPSTASSSAAVKNSGSGANKTD
jgi:putative FmdB family regulatory protein